MNKVIYEVTYIPNAMAKRMSDLMSGFDLGIEKIYTRDNFIITTKTKVTKSYVNKMAKVIKLAIEKVGGELIEIKHKESLKITK